MSNRELVFRIGGAAGDGVASTAESFAKICSRSGLWTWTYSSYQSVIRGGHVWTQVRGREEEVLSQGEDPHVLVALNPDTADIHVGEVRSGGAIVYDPDTAKVDPTKVRKNVRVLGPRLRRMAQEHGTNALMKNSVALGAVVRLFDMDPKQIELAFQDIFGKKKAEVVAANVKAASAGYDWVGTNGGSLGLGLAYSNKPRVLITGNQAICLGALAAGCKFLAQYPMTPASSILHWMASHASKYGVVVKQVEDELAAINMTVGAGFAGVRAMTATSGGGFSLMVEGIGQGGMVEAPCVVVLSQRSGPSTGLPTKTEQGDLNLALGAGQGDWPRAILAPRNTEECFRLTADAFNLAEIYQTPIIVLSDLYLSEGYRTVEGFDFNVPIIRGLVAADGGEPKGNYMRYRLTDTGVSPRALPGQRGFQHIAATDEHTENSELISDVLAGIPEYVEMRNKMHEKRMRKLDGLRKDTRGPELWGPKKADLTLISWGSTQGPLREALLRLKEEGFAVNSLEYSCLFPFHVDETLAALKGAKRTMAVEENYTGQFARLLRTETGHKVDHFFGKYDGEPFYPREIVAKAKEALA